MVYLCAYLRYFVNTLTPETFRNSLEKIVPGFRDKSFLVAVSGGADSMVLLRLMKGLNCKIEVAHVNYKLRGESSDLDEELVRKFCEQENIKLNIYTVSDVDKKPEYSIQEWARNIRYRFFEQCLEESNLDYIVTAHHLNDQLETFLINLSKAAGIQGLTGTPEANNKIVRPLLTFSKEEIIRYTAQQSIPFREDESNQKPDYLRNKIRLEVVPKLMEINPNFLQNFSKSLVYLNQTKVFTEQILSKIENEILVKEQNAIIADRKKLSGQESYIKFEILRKFGFEKEAEIEKIFAAESGKKFHSKQYSLTIEREQFVLKPKENSKKEKSETVFKDVESLTKFQFETDEEYSGKTWFFDADKLKFPLVLRKKQDGDFFYPIKMKGKKLASKFLKDEKIPILARSKIRLLCDPDGNILGIFPLRQDRRFAADDETKVKIEIKF